MADDGKPTPPDISGSGGVIIDFATGAQIPSNGGQPIEPPNEEATGETPEPGMITVEDLIASFANLVSNINKQHRNISTTVALGIVQTALQYNLQERAQALQEAMYNINAGPTNAEQINDE